MDLILRNARLGVPLAGGAGLWEVDIGIDGGVIVALEPGLEASVSRR